MAPDKDATFMARALELAERGRGFVTPDDIKSIALDILRHRVVLSYEAEAAGVNNDDIVTRIVEGVEVP